MSSTPHSGSSLIWETAPAATGPGGPASRWPKRGSLPGRCYPRRRESCTQAGPDGRVTVHHAGGDAYAITVRGHAVLVDQPEAAGGQDAAATPTELLVASLASCVAFYAGRYLLRHGLDRPGLAVTAEFTMASDRPARVGDVRLRISVPGPIPAQRRDALLAVASHCTVHNTLRQQPGINIELD